MRRKSTTSPIDRNANNNDQGSSTSGDIYVASTPKHVLRPGRAYERFIKDTNYITQETIDRANLKMYGTSTQDTSSTRNPLLDLPEYDPSVLIESGNRRPYERRIR